MRVPGAFAEVERLVGEFRALDPAIGKIVLFGSLARKDVRSLDFDIDLAVACSKEKYLSIVALALDSPFKVDVVDLAAAPHFLLNVLAEYAKMSHMYDMGGAACCRSA